MQDIEHRLEQLEIKASYQEDMVQELNGIVVSQQQKIDQLETLLNGLNRRLAELSASMPADPDSVEKPPHY